MDILLRVHVSITIDLIACMSPETHLFGLDNINNSSIYYNYFHNRGGYHKSKIAGFFIKRGFWLLLHDVHQRGMSYTLETLPNRGIGIDD